MKSRALIYDAARALPVYPAIPGRLVILGGAVTALGAFLGAPFTAGAFLLTLLVAVPVTAWWFVREVVPAQTTKGTIARKGDRQQRAGGVASVWDVLERASSGALRRRATILRPSLARLPRRHRAASAVGVLLARTGLGIRLGQQLWSACEDTTLRVGGPRTGKSLSLACHGLDAPGALITTSTRFDLAKHVHAARRAWPADWQLTRARRVGRGLRRRHLIPLGQERAVHVYNPTGYGGVRSTVRWNILSGCEDYGNAQRRAADLIPESRSTEGERWDRMARGYLPILLHAAALSRRNVPDVLRWVEQIGQEDRDGSRLPKIRREIADVLSQVPNGEYETGLLGAFLSLPDRTRGSVTGMMQPALAWIADETAADIGAAPLGTTTLNVQQLIRDGETLHIVGPSQVGSFIAPLTSAFVAEIAWQARMLASVMPGERLDPFLTMLLDEAAVTVQLPLDKWTADMGGRGISLHMSVQSLSQLEQTWGSAGAGTLLGNVGSLVMFGGSKDADELERVSKLCGDRWRRVITEDTKVLARIAGVQRGEWEKVRVLTPADLTNMPPAQVAVLQRNLGGVFVGRAPLVHERRGWTSVELHEPVPAPRAAGPESVPVTVPLDVQETAS